ncbi:MAG: hypothetical protein LUC41_04630, partial [Clostridiales bacterium]|nr:hypothetical protein [Clostridiales bacterium]
VLRRYSLRDSMRDPADAHRIGNRNQIFDPGYLPGEIGIYMLENGMTFPEPILHLLLGHNYFEFTNLAAILSEVYAEEKDNWA